MNMHKNARLTPIGRERLIELMLSGHTPEGERCRAPYSPDFNPIENAFSKLKSFLRKAAARTAEDLWRITGEAIDAFTPGECQNYFAACGYDCD